MQSFVIGACSPATSRDYVDRHEIATVNILTNNYMKYKDGDMDAHTFF